MTRHEAWGTVTSKDTKLEMFCMKSLAIRCSSLPRSVSLDAVLDEALKWKSWEEKLKTVT